MKYEEDEELTMEEDRINTFKNTYVANVYKSLGLMHLVVILAILFCYIVIFLPTAIRYGYESVDKLIKFLSRGSQNWESFYWGFFGTFSIIVLVLPIILKVVDKLNNKSNNKSISSSL